MQSGLHAHLDEGAVPVALTSTPNAIDLSGDVVPLRSRSPASLKLAPPLIPVARVQKISEVS